MVDDDRERVHVVDSIDADDSALCAFATVRGRVFAAVNSEYRALAVQHIREHVARGFLGPRVCAVDCQLQERVR